MPTMTAYAHGQFCWVDLMAHDLAAAKAFYGGLFGWVATDQDTQGGYPYVIYSLNGHHIAGMGLMGDDMKANGTPPVWNSYVNVDNIQSTIDQATGSGATLIMPAMQVMQAGHMAILQDPQGAMLSLWQGIDHTGAQFVNEPNSWAWNELMTPAPQESIEFFGNLFGWKFEKEPNSPTDYWMIKNGERMNGGVMQMPPELEGVPPHWGVYFSVADIHAATEKVKELGGTVCREPFEVSVGHISVVTDDQGGTFLMIQMTVPPDV